MKRKKRDAVPASWGYVEEKRWTLLEVKTAGPAASSLYARDSVEGKALLALHDFAGCSEGFRKIYVRSEGVSYRLPMTPQVLAFAQMPGRADWVTITRQQAGAWEGLLRDVVTIGMRKRFAEGDRAPWPWPPAADGKIYASETGPPQSLMDDTDLEDFK
ncbi:MAG: hypothetical protein PS018_20380 [bacterium]|nr:hypothetical protein [bacterium]